MTRSSLTFAALSNGWLLFCFVIGCHRWFHGRITRQQAEDLLQPPSDGLFVVRESTSFPGDYTLCVSYDSKVEHYHIMYKDTKLTIDEEECFETLNQLIEVRMAFLLVRFLRTMSNMRLWDGNMLHFILVQSGAFSTNFIVLQELIFFHETIAFWVAPSVR